MHVVKKQKEIQDFLMSCAQLVWKMTVQQPMMTFDISPTVFDSKFHEPLYPNIHPENGQKIVDYAIPILRGARDSIICRAKVIV